MSKGLFPEIDTNVHYFSRIDEEETLGTWIHCPFRLENKEWLTIEHYFQAMKFADETYQEKIRLAASAKQARKLGRTRFKRIKTNWRDLRAVFMTRAVYTRCKTYPDLARHLMNTGSKKLMENSQYDYYWGCGRDRRGTNMYGQVLMNVRDKLRDESRR